MNSLLLISHSTEKTGGGEDDFERITKYLYGKYILYGVLPAGDRVSELSKYFEDYMITKSNIFPFSKLSNPKYYVYYYLNAKRINRQINDFILNKSINCAFVNSSANFSVLSVLHRNKVPSIISIKEIIKPCYIRNGVYFYINKMSTKVILISKYIESKTKKYIKGNKVNVIYSSIEEIPNDQTNMLYESVISNESILRIVNIGVIAPYKGQDILLEAVKSIKNFNISITFIGRVTDDNYYRKLLSKTKKLRDNIKVEFMNELSKREVYNEISHSSVVIVSSLEEGFSLVILEALMLKRLIISSDVGIAGEVIKNNVNGFIYSAGNHQELSKLLNHIILNKSLINEMPKNALIYFEDKFNLISNLEKIHLLLESTMLEFS